MSVTIRLGHDPGSFNSNLGGIWYVKTGREGSGVCLAFYPSSLGILSSLSLVETDKAAIEMQACGVKGRWMYMEQGRTPGRWMGSEKGVGLEPMKPCRVLLWEPH